MVRSHPAGRDAPHSLLACFQARLSYLPSAASKRRQQKGRGASAGRFAVALAEAGAGVAVNYVRSRHEAVNLKSAFLCTQAVLPGMRARCWGRIVNISSGAARGGGVVGVHYNASKAGLEGLTRGYAARLVRNGITSMPCRLR